MMSIFDRLISASNTTNELNSFLKENIQELYDFLIVQSFTDLSRLITFIQ